MNENDGRVVIEITGDDSGLENALTDAEQRTRDSASRAAQTAQQASQAAQTAAGAAASAADAFSRVGSSAGDASSSVSGAASAISSAGTAASSAAGAINNVSSAVSAVNASAGSAASAMGNVGSSAQSAADAVSAVGSAAASASASVDGTASATASASSAAADYTAALNGLQSTLTACSDSLTGIDSHLSEMSSGIHDTGDSADDTDGILQKLGSTIKGVFTVALIKEFAEAVADVGKEFEYSLDKVSSIADTTAVSVGEISDGILSLSSETGVHAADLNEAMYQAISAGVDTADAIDMVETAVKSAKAGFTDTTTAVDGLTTVLNAYKTANLDANDVANKFLITQNLGKTSFGEIASSIGNIAPTANAAGVTIEELLSAVASLTANGIATSEAMTGLKAAMSNIITPSSNAAKTAEELGIEFNAAALQSKGLEGFMNDLAEATGGDTEVMAQLFGSVEALNTMLTLTSEGGAELFSKTMSEMETNTTALDSAYDTMTDNLTSNLDVMKTSVENFGIDIYNSVSGGLQDVVQSATDYIERLRAAFTEDGFDGFAGELFQIAFDAISEFGNGLADALPDIVTAALNTVTTVADTILDNIDTVVDTAEDIISGLAEGLISAENISILTEKVPEIVVKLTDKLVEEIPEVLRFTVKLFETLADELVHFDWSEAAERMLTNLADALDEAQKNVAITLDNIFTGGSVYGGDRDKVDIGADIFGSAESIRAGTDEVVGAIRTGQTAVADAYDSGNEILGEKASSSTGLTGAVPSGQNVYGGIMDNWDGVSEELSKVPGQLDNVAESSANASADLEDSGETAGKVSEEFKSWYTELETLKAHGTIDDDEFKRRLSAKLNSSAEYLDSAYNSYWTKIQDTSKKSSSDAKEKVSDDFQSFIDEQDRLLALGTDNGGIDEATYYQRLGEMLNSTPDSKTNPAYSKYWKSYNTYLKNKEKRDAENFKKQEAVWQTQLQKHQITEEQYWEKVGNLLEQDPYKDNAALNSFRKSYNSYIGGKNKRQAQDYKEWAAELENDVQDPNKNYSEEDLYKDLKEKLWSDEYIDNPELNSERDKVTKWFEDSNKRQAQDYKEWAAELWNRVQDPDDDYSEEDYWHDINDALNSDKYKDNTELNSERDKVKDWFDKSDKRGAEKFKGIKDALENKKQNDENYSEEDYYNDLRELLYSDEYKNNTELNGERDKVDKWFEESDKRQAESVKGEISKLEAAYNNHDITEEEYYQKLGELVFADDTKYNQYLESFRKQVNSYYDKKQSEADKEALDNQKKAAKEELSQLKSDLTDLVNEYKEKVSELTKARDSFQSKLTENIFTTKAETVTDKRTGQTHTKKTDTVADLQKKIAARKKLRDVLDSLVNKKGMPQGLISELAGMDPEDALRFAEQLDKMDLGKLQNIFDSYAEYEEINKEIADNIYGPQITALNTQFADDLRSILGDVSGEAAEKGAEFILSFASGVDLSSDDAIESIKKFGDETLQTLSSAVSVAKLEDGKMVFTVSFETDETDAAEVGQTAGESIGTSIADGIADKSDEIAAAVSEAVTKGLDDMHAAVDSKQSAAAGNASAEAAANTEDSPASSADSAAQDTKVANITIDGVKLVMRDGRVLAEIVNEENRKIQITGGKIQ